MYFREFLNLFRAGRAGRSVRIRSPDFRQKKFEHQSKKHRQESHFEKSRSEASAQSEDHTQYRVLG